MITRIAMWSGPRNISTALMRSWDSRPDTVVCDEPLYAHYLQATGIDHPGRDEIVAHHETDLTRVFAHLLGPLPQGKLIFYQKHMAHHLLPGMDRGWLDGLTNCFLIRDPREVLLSYSKVIARPTVEDLGYPQQWELFQREEKRTGRTPVVLDAQDILENPRRMLERWCERIGVTFDERQLSWAAGSRPTDGVWAKHWYAAVERSTSFEPYRPRMGEIPDHLLRVFEDCRPYYSELHARRLAP